MNALEITFTVIGIVLLLCMIAAIYFTKDFMVVDKDQCQACEECGDAMQAQIDQLLNDNPMSKQLMNCSMILDSQERAIAEKDAQIKGLCEDLKRLGDQYLRLQKDQELIAKAYFRVCDKHDAV